MSRNPEALKIFAGQLKVYTPSAPIPIRLQSVEVGSIKAGSELEIHIRFNQGVSDFTIADIEVTAPAQLITWLGTGRVKKNAMGPGLPQLSYSLIYDVSSAFDASALPDDYELSISIRANSIIGDGSRV